mmetsp:Transcript_47914/g.91595  ORF Transcript_47914/g.91595 Transcript_47914/m.91595 type:complete len:207 (-) Transcript_47914:203-823(-)
MRVALPIVWITLGIKGGIIQGLCQSVHDWSSGFVLRTPVALPTTPCLPARRQHALPPQVFHLFWVSVAGSHCPVTPLRSAFEDSRGSLLLLVVNLVRPKLVWQVLRKRFYRSPSSLLHHLLQSRQLLGRHHNQSQPLGSKAARATRSVHERGSLRRQGHAHYHVDVLQVHSPRSQVRGNEHPQLKGAHLFHHSHALLLRVCSACEF